MNRKNLKKIYSLLLSLKTIQIAKHSAILTQIRTVYKKSCHQQKLIAF